ncbi:MAG TPA: AAA family ATPase [Candidatus Binataceae bacterium]|nr:AAA family ATPase [Candidatus Binataceae bacterium]
MPSIDMNNAKKATLRIDLLGQAPELRQAAVQALSRVIDPPLKLVEPETEGEANGHGAIKQAVDVSIVMFDGRDDDKSLAHLENLSAQKPRPVLFGLLNERSPGLMKRVIRAGADELLFMPLDPGDLTRALFKVSETRVRAVRHDGGKVISLASVVGGVGVSSIAANLAFALRYHFDKRVALVDLDLQGGALAVLLNVEPELTILPLCRLDKKLDSIQLEAVLTKHPSGAYLLAAPKRIEEGELVSDSTVGSVIDSMRDMFDFVIVDCGHHLDENSVAAWERSNHLLYVLNQSVTSVRSAWRFIDLFERLSLAVEPHYVINRFVQAHGISQKQLENTLGHPMYSTILRDDKSLELAELSGKDLWQVAGGSPLAKTFEALAARLANIETAKERDKHFISRLFSFGAHV